MKCLQSKTVQALFAFELLTVKTYLHPQKPRASKGEGDGKETVSNKNKEKEGEGQGRERRKGKPWKSSLQKVFLNHFISWAVIGLILNLN